jgi:hypothetical protein
MADKIVTAARSFIAELERAVPDWRKWRPGAIALREAILDADTKISSHVCPFDHGCIHEHYCGRMNRCVWQSKISRLYE